MKQWEKVELVQRMQDYIQAHLTERNVCWDAFYRQTGYSSRHAVRIFRELLGKTPEEYLRAIKLTESAARLIREQNTILEIALDADYDSHEGYTKAFVRQFGTKPSVYRQGKVPIPWFIPYPIRHSVSPNIQKECIEMERETNICTVTMPSRPKRKLLLLYAKSANDYFSFCEEKGCQWEGLFNSIPSKLDTAAILDLPPSLQKEGMAAVAAGVELPWDYEGEIPPECALLTLEPCDMMFVQSPPFEKEDDFPQAIAQVWSVLERYDPKAYGYRYAPELAPRYNYGASAQMGAKMAVPVIKL